MNKTAITVIAATTAIILALGLGLGLGLNSSSEPEDATTETPEIPETPKTSITPVSNTTTKFNYKHFYEIRGVWVATVAQIDYPAKLGANLSSEHKSQLKNIVLQSKNLGLNTIYFHVRPNSDAFYKSDLECWSYWLTGEEGKSPENSEEDPLRWILEFAHEYSMQVHAWINPYRASSSSVKSGPCERNMMKRFPENAFDYPPGSGSWAMDPGSRQVQQHIVDVVDDMLNKYKVVLLKILDLGGPKC